MTLFRSCQYFIEWSHVSQTRFLCLVVWCLSGNICAVMFWETSYDKKKRGKYKYWHLKKRTYLLIMNRHRFNIYIVLNLSSSRLQNSVCQCYEFQSHRPNSAVIHLSSSGLCVANNTFCITDPSLRALLIDIWIRCLLFHIEWCDKALTHNDVAYYL